MKYENILVLFLLIAVMAVVGHYQTKIIVEGYNVLSNRQLKHNTCSNVTEYCNYAITSLCSSN